MTIPLSLCENDQYKTVRSVELATYPNAHHSLTLLILLNLFLGAIRLKDMFIDLKMDGRQIFTDENNNTFHLDSLEERMRC